MPYKTPTLRSPHPPAPQRDARQSSTQRGYGAEWRKVRAAHLRAQPNCVQCGDVAEHVDHILPLAQGGTHAAANLQSLCQRCHSRKTARSDGGFGNARRS